MIAYFPTPYPDELLYSQLARYYTKSWYMADTYAAEELYVLKTVRPDMEFVNTFTPASLRMITKDMPMEDAPIPVLTDRENSRKLERKGAPKYGREKSKKGNVATTV